MLAFIFLLIILMPLLEIYVFVQVWTSFGWQWAFIGSIVTALLGTAILRWQGLHALNQLRQHMAEKTTPVEPVIDGVFLIIAAPFLITPGFITDTIGFALLVPPIRHAIARYFLGKIRASVDRGDTKIMFRRF